MPSEALLRVEILWGPPEEQVHLHEGKSRHGSGLCFSRRETGDSSSALPYKDQLSRLSSA